ncbi:MAG TPA: ATP-binding SpoIIE family protein phosphatase [Steroidobacteraceae bacterium]|nr:ATP-binding SpoIIE family protein phosphatase [Steroidobacteraceae bacterium]
MEVAVEFRTARAAQRFVIDEASKVGEARRAAQTLANFEFNADLASDVAIAATELANNLNRHAGGGELIVQHIGDDDHSVIELLAIDRGPGMADVAKCLTDGYSTIGTPGTGLGAVRRLANDFDIYSHPGEGTVVMARFGHELPVRHGAVNITVEGEVECGDAWKVARGEEGIAVVVVDGLGHGSFAAEAARACLDAFDASPFAPPQEVMTRANAAMSKTRGGAAASALLVGDRLSYSGVGNIGGTLVSAGKSQGLVSHNGTLGINQRRAQQFEYRCEPRALLVMHSDGVSGRWDLKHRPDLLGCHPSVIAGVLYRDHRRERDDATVVVVAP